MRCRGIGCWQLLFLTASVLSFSPSFSSEELSLSLLLAARTSYRRRRHRKTQIQPLVWIWLLFDYPFSSSLTLRLMWICIRLVVITPLRPSGMARVHPLTEWTISAFAFPAEAGTHLPTPERWKAELALGGSLVTYRNKCPAPGIEPDTVAHLSTNRARRRLTSLIEANALTTTPDRQGCPTFAEIHVSVFFVELSTTL